MADLSWEHNLLDDQLGNPVLYSEFIELNRKVPLPNEADLLQVFKADGYKLQTWGRSLDLKGKVIKKNDPHWIAVRRNTPLHYDPSYPRYSHHLKVRVDPEVYVRGLNKKELLLQRGTFYILDTHSPHQVFHRTKLSVWNVAASIDTDQPLKPKDALQRLLHFVETTSVTGENLLRK